MTVPQCDSPEFNGAGFINRTTELAELADLIRRSRLVTLTGIGGIGKTQLALRAAAGVAGEFRDGVRLVELSALRDPGLLAHTIASGLGLPEQEARSASDSVLSYLAGRRMLLILDACEHLVEPCALFAESVLTRAPEVTIIATSRQPLDAPGEQGYPVAPLPVAQSSGDDGAAVGARPGHAVDLFVTRAAAAVPGFALTDDTREDVISLCRRLDGIPLAIELAAARLRGLPLKELSGRLGRDLRETIGWSYELCDPAERLLWERASVFAGSFGVDAAEQVCSGRGLAREAVLDAIFGLTDKSVLLPADSGGGAPRYRMLDTIREYGAERLAASGIEAGVRQRMIARYRAVAEEFDTSPLQGQLQRYQDLHREHDGIRAALEYAITMPGQETAAASLAVSLHWYWQISGLLQEGCHWLTRVLELFPGPSPERARALGLRGFLASYGGQPGGLADTEAALALAERHQDRLGRAWLYHVRALLTVGRLPEAEEAGRTAAALLTAQGDTGLLPVLDVMIAFKHFAAGEMKACLARCDEGLRRAPVDDGERWASSYLLGLTGLAMFALGEQEKGSAATREAMAMKQELGDTAGIAYGLGTLAMMAAGEGRFKRVAWLLGAADPLWDRLGSVLGGTPEMRQQTEQIIAAARETLGAERYDHLFRAASRVPLDTIVTLAVNNDDELPPLPAR